MKNDFPDQSVPPEKCVEMLQQVLICLDHVATTRPEAEAAWVPVASAHLQTVIDLLAEL